MNLNIFFVSIIFVFQITIVFSNRFHTHLVAHTFLKHTNKNVVISTLSLQFSLCKLATIAEGKAKEEIMNSLEFKNDREPSQCYPAVREVIEGLIQLDMNFFNKMYIDYDKIIDQKFVADSRKKFGVDVEKIGFKYPKTAIDFLNREVSQATLKRVTDIVEGSDLTNQTCMMLITGAQLRPTWETRFNPQRTKLRNFYGPAGMSQVNMMTKDDEVLFHDHRHYKIVVIKLQYGTTMTLVIPTLIRGITGFLHDLTYNPNLMKELRQNMEWKLITLVIPKFKIKTYLDLTDMLNTTEISEIFMKNTTLLKNILKDKDPKEEMYVSKIKQKIIMNIDEYGVIRDNSRIPSFESKDHRLKSFSRTMFELVIDRPFYFSINLEISLIAGGKYEDPYYELFSGVYYGPES